MFDTVVYTVISLVKEEDKLVGYVLTHEKLESNFISVEYIKVFADKVRYTNAKYDPATETLVGINRDLDTLPVVDRAGNIIGKGGITVIYNIKDEVTKDVVGAVIYNALGVRSNVTISKLKELSKSNINSNFKLMNTKNGIEIKTLDDEDFPSLEMTVKRNVKRVYNSGAGETAPAFEIVQEGENLPSLNIYHFDNVKSICWYRQSNWYKCS